MAELFGGTVIGGGDILRGSDIPAHVKAIMHAGLLIPSADYVNIVLPYLSQSELAGSPLILSAVGRWHGEEIGVIEALQYAGHPLQACIYLSVDEATIMNRWHAHEEHKDRSVRHDDAIDVLMARFAEFHAKTMPVIEYYRSRGRLIEVDSTGTREEVTRKIIDGLIQLAHLQPRA